MNVIILTVLSILPSWHNHKDNVQRDLLLAARADNLLREARYLGGEIIRQHQFDESCTANTARVLEQAVLNYPHIHGVFLYREGEIYCSSLRQRFTPGKAFEELIRSPFEEHTILLKGRDEFPGKVFLAYIRGDEHHGVIITIDAYWLHRWYANDGQNSILIKKLLLNSDLSITCFKQVRGKINRTVKSSFSGVSVVSFIHDDPTEFSWPLIGTIIILSSLFIFIVLGRYYKKSFPVTRQLKHAIRSKEIGPWYQPIVDARSGVVSGAEVLVRWHHPRKGIVSPDVFIPVAERSGLFIPMTLALLNQVRHDMNSLKFNLPENFYISISIIAGPETLEALSSKLIRFKYDFLERVRLVVELTERTTVQTDSSIIGLLKDLRSEGIDIALDKFFITYSNLCKISTIPVTMIKIDPCLIKTLAESTESQHLVESIIKLARSNCLSVVAEGVETAFQSDFLTFRGVALQQGHYWSKPLPVMDFTRFLIRHKAESVILSEKETNYDIRRKALVMR